MVASGEQSPSLKTGSNMEEEELDFGAAVEFKNKYDIKERLGKGLSSVVYVCVEKNTGKEFAVKVMDIAQDHVNADGMDIVQQIHEEIRLLQLVEGHEFIIKLTDVFESPTFIFLVFELCQNNDLFEYLSAHVSLSEKKCRVIMKQIFEAVYYCHQVSGKHLEVITIRETRLFEFPLFMSIVSRNCVEGVGVTYTMTQKS